MIEQLCLFTETREEILERRLHEIHLSAEKNRKSLHAKNAQITKELHELKHEVKSLIQALCRSQNNDYANLPLFTDRFIGT